MTANSITPSERYYNEINCKPQRQQSSSKAIIKTTITAPGDSDILCGRSKESFHHVGNQLFRAVLKEKIAVYANTQSRTGKSALILQLTRTFLYQYGARFLKLHRNGNGWVELDETGARKKVGHALRDMYAAQQSLLNKRKHGRSRDIIHKLNQTLQQHPTKSNMFKSSMSIPDSQTFGLKTNHESLLSEAYSDHQPDYNHLLDPDPLPLADGNGRPSRFRMSAMQIMREILDVNVILDDPKDALPDPINISEEVEFDEDLISPMTWDALRAAF